MQVQKRVIAEKKEKKQGKERPRHVLRLTKDENIILDALDMIMKVSPINPKRKKHSATKVVPFLVWT